MSAGIRVACGPAILSMFSGEYAISVSIAGLLGAVFLMSYPDWAPFSYGSHCTPSTNTLCLLVKPCGLVVPTEPAAA